MAQSDVKGLNEQDLYTYKDRHHVTPLFRRVKTQLRPLSFALL